MFIARLFLLISSILFLGGQAQPFSQTNSVHRSQENETSEASALPTTGSKDFAYSINSQWASLPRGMSLGATHGGVAICETGEVFISTNGPMGIIQFEKNGDYRNHFGKETSRTHSLFINKESDSEYLYASQLSRQRIIKLDLQGKLIFEITHTEKNPIPGTLKGITSVAVAEDGRIYATTGYGSNRLHIFCAKGTLIKSVGSKGNGTTQTNTNHGVSIDKRYQPHRLLIADRENRRLVHYDLDGNFLTIYAKSLKRPCASSFFGDICAVAELEGRVTLLDKNGKLLVHLGENPNPKQWARFKIPLGTTPFSSFSAPHGLAFTKRGDLIVQDWNAYGRITLLSLKKGKLDK